MKLDPTVMRTMTGTDFRVLEAVEKGMKDHALVPEPLIAAQAGLRHGGTHKHISSLLRDKLLSHECKRSSWDGYRLTNAGYDVLALHNLKQRGFVAALGQRIGTGKESDIYLAATPTGKQIVLKFHRLGRTSFRNVKKKRDYFGKQAQQAHSWLFLSKLSAVREYAFMKALHDKSYPTPTPVAHNRHVVAMSLVRGVPLYQIFPKQLSVEQAADIYQQALRLASRLARQHGLVHCDLNEFNLLVDLSGIQGMVTDDTHDPYVRHSGLSVSSQSVSLLSKPAWEQSLEAAAAVNPEPPPEPAARLLSGEPKPVVTLIDFPQMVSTQHVNAQELYERDLASLRRFFTKKLLCHIPDDDETTVEAAWKNVVAGSAGLEERLDGDLRASGYAESEVRDLELYYFQSGPRPIASALQEGDEDDDHESYDEEEDSDSDQHEGVQEDPVERQQEGPHEDLSAEDLSADDKQEPNEMASQAMDSCYRQVVFDREQLQNMSREQLQELAKERVRRQLEDAKRKSRKQGAFRKRNRNKNYVKGKRVMEDSF
jgi:RIO kinase 2